MLTPNIIPVIITAGKYKLTAFKAYQGYAGADILKLTFIDVSEMVIIRDYARSLGHTTSVKSNAPLVLYCIFDVPDDVYQLK